MNSEIPSLATSTICRKIAVVACVVWYQRTSDQPHRYQILAGVGLTNMSHTHIHFNISITLWTDWVSDIHKVSDRHQHFMTTVWALNHPCNRTP